ncbi:cobalt ECF transporter T component CbiQ [Nitrospirota bacterium]
MVHGIQGPEKNLLGLDVRVKLLLLAGVLALVLSHEGIIFPIIVAVVSLLLCFWIRVPVRMVLVRFAEPLVLVTVIVMLKMFSGTDSITSFSIAGYELTIYRDGLWAGVIIAVRIAAALGAVTVLSVSTPFMDIFGGLSWFRVPRPFVEVAMFACRYIAMLFDEAQVIHRAQKNRLGYSGVRRSFQSFGTLAGALVIKSFDHAMHTATALRQRGYEGAIPEVEHKPFRGMEIIKALVIMTVMVVLWQIP